MTSCVVMAMETACLEKTALFILEEEKRKTLCVIQPVSMAVQSKTAFSQMEKFPYPFAPRSCFNTGMERPMISAGSITLSR